MGADGGGSHDAFYRRGSNMSDASFMQDVDMASEEMFSGPMSESIPTSNTGFAHRRSRADSTASFTYYDEEEVEENSSDSWLEEEVILEDADSYAPAEGDEYAIADRDIELENGIRRSSKHRKSSAISRMSRRSVSSRRSRTSSDDPLLHRHDSNGSAKSNISGVFGKDRTSQKIYIQSEDLTIVLAGFTTSLLGFATYIAICILTGGIGYLLLRWLPRWRIRLVGSAKPLREAQWIVVEVRVILQNIYHTLR